MAKDQSGFTLVEMLVSMTLLVLVAGGLAEMMIDNSALNRGQQMRHDPGSAADRR